jgi:hypothetical protein
MSSETKDTGISPEFLAEMEEAARIALSNVRNPEIMRQAAERMDRTREELCRQYGEMSIAVNLIREVRDEE